MGKNLSFVLDDFSTSGKRGKKKILISKSQTGLYSNRWPRVPQIHLCFQCVKQDCTKLHEIVLALLHYLKASKTSRKGKVIHCPYPVSEKKLPLPLCVPIRSLVEKSKVCAVRFTLSIISLLWSVRCRTEIDALWFSNTLKASVFRNCIRIHLQIFVVPTYIDI